MYYVAIMHLSRVVLGDEGSKIVQGQLCHSNEVTCGRLILCKLCTAV